MMIYLADAIRPANIFGMPCWGDADVHSLDSQEGSGMWGMIAKITLLAGGRDEMIEILEESAANMQGCLSFVVAKDAVGENTI
jgi:hypothetical protein